jgi:enterochelin esterase-like enzyme
MRKNAELTIGNQRVWCHDEEHAAGYFHTYSHFQTDDVLYPERKIQVFVPRGYEQSSISYPVLYMNDGNTTFFKGGLAHQSLDLATTLSALYAHGAIRQLVVVAIWPVNRNREYTHTWWGDPDCCELEAYTQCIARWIKPFIDCHYRTLPHPANTMILGSSHGGLAAFYIANRLPDLFGYGGALSPSFWVGLDDATSFPIIRPCRDKSLRDSQLLAHVQDTLSQPTVRPKLYIDWGLIRDGGPHNEYIEERATARGREMVELLHRDFGYQIGTDLIVYEDPLGRHQEASWGRHMPRILKWFAKKP